MVKMNDEQKSPNQTGTYLGFFKGGRPEAGRMENSRGRKISDIPL